MLLRAAHVAVRRCAFAASRPASGAAAPPAPLPPHYVFTLPPLSPAMASGRVVRWHASPGTRLEPGDALCDVATDTLLERDGGGDAGAETVLVVELHEEAWLAALVHPVSAGGPSDLPVPVGSPLALLCEDARDASTLAAAAARGYGGGDVSARAPLWQAHLAAAATDADSPRGCH